MISLAALGAAMLLAAILSLVATRWLAPARAALLLAAVLGVSSAGYAVGMSVLLVDVAADLLVAAHRATHPEAPLARHDWSGWAVVVCGAFTLGRWLGGARRAMDSAPVSADLGGGVAVVNDARPMAFAVPGSPGTVVVSDAMVGALADDELRAVVAHEQAHLSFGHHRLLWLARAGELLVPFVGPLSNRLRVCTEQWADDEAARAVGDRTTVARAVARAALAQVGEAPTPRAATRRHDTSDAFGVPRGGWSGAPGLLPDGPPAARRSGAASGATSTRVVRLLRPPAPRWAAVAGIVLGGLALVATAAAAVLQFASVAALVTHMG
ncbi:MAG: M56 family metallopeptidase [Acidimicrobiales bacterium]|nr:M56 family metallopeptidase [Acidimicrobiales bacterium]